MRKNGDIVVSDPTDEFKITGHELGVSTFKMQLSGVTALIGQNSGILSSLPIKQGEDYYEVGDTLSQLVDYSGTKFTGFEVNKSNQTQVLLMAEDKAPKVCISANKIRYLTSRNCSSP